MFWLAKFHHGQQEREKTTPEKDVAPPPSSAFLFFSLLFSYFYLFFFSNTPSLIYLTHLCEPVKIKTSAARHAASHSPSPHLLRGRMVLRQSSGCSNSSTHATVTLRGDLGKLLAFWLTSPRIFTGLNWIASEVFFPSPWSINCMIFKPLNLCSNVLWKNHKDGFVSLSTISLFTFFTCAMSNINRTHSVLMSIVRHSQASISSLETPRSCNPVKLKPQLPPLVCRPSDICLLQHLYYSLF